MVERIPAMMIELAPQNRSSVVASADNTAAALVITSLIRVVERTISEFCSPGWLYLTQYGTSFPDSSVSKIPPDQLGPWK